MRNDCRIIDRREDHEAEINEIIGIFAEAAGKKAEKVTFLDDCTVLDPDMLREDEFMAQPVFNIYHSETAMMRYMKNLERRDTLWRPL